MFRTLQSNWPERPEVRSLLFKFLLCTNRGHSIVSSSDCLLSDNQQRLTFQLLHAEWLIVTGRVPEARTWLEPSLQDQSLEASILAARCDKSQGDLLGALGRFTALLERAPTHFQLWMFALETALDAKHSDSVRALSKQALHRIGETLACFNISHQSRCCSASQVWPGAALCWNSFGPPHCVYQVVGRAIIHYI